MLVYCILPTLHVWVEKLRNFHSTGLRFQNGSAHPEIWCAALGIVVVVSREKEMKMIFLKCNCRDLNWVNISIQQARGGVYRVLALCILRLRLISVISFFLV